MTRLRHILPDGLAGRFALLLITVLLAASLVAMGLLFVERGRLERNAREAQEIVKIAALVEALEASPPEMHARLTREASSRFTRFTLKNQPVIRGAKAPLQKLPHRLRKLTAELSDALPQHDIRSAILTRHDRANLPGRPQLETLAVSIRLPSTPGTGQEQWLNMISRGDWLRPPGARGTVLPLFLGLSLLSVLGVGLIFVRRLTRPLTELANAARAAGRGDRTVRVSETGARELREAAKAFNEMQARIARFDAERMRTLAAVGHDLRTPITSLRIRAELLGEEDARPMIRTLGDMTVMADGLVAYARGAGDGEETVALDLAPLLARLCDERGAGFQARRQAQVTGRAVALGRAIGNVVDNALRFGSSAQVALTRDQEAAIITVEDDGPGIPSERLDAMFEPFVRGDDSRSLDTGGAGLGLAIARNIIAAHGGMITLENRPEGGLRATIRLPVWGKG